MDVLNIVIENTALKGMPKWYQAVSLTLFMIIATVVISTYVLLVVNGADMAVRFSY